MDAIQGGFMGASIACGAIGLYVRLSLKSFIIDTLNGRYPTTKVMDANFRTITARFDALHEAMEGLPCKMSGGVCTGHADLANACQAMEIALTELRNRNFGGQGQE